MTLDQKFETLKQGLSIVGGVRKVLVEVFESIVASVKTYAKNREGMPTVEEAFKQRGMNYKTIDSQIRRERERRLEYAQFYAAIKAEAAALKAQESQDNINGLDLSDDDLPPVNTEVVLNGGRKGVILAQGVMDGGKSAEVYLEDDGTTEIVKASDLVTLASVVERKAAAKAAKKAAQENSPEAEQDKTDCIVAAAAEEDDALKSSDFYADQYFALVALIKAAPKEMTPAEFAQTVNDNLRAAADAMNAEEAKRLKPAPPMLPSFKGTKGMATLLAFLSVDAVGRPSPLKTIFGGLDKEGFARKMNTFMQRICDMFHEGEFEIVLADGAKARKAKYEAAKAKEAAATSRSPEEATSMSAKEQANARYVGTKSEPTTHGFFYEFRLHEKTPYVVRDTNNPNLGILHECKNKADAELKVATYEREAAAAAIKATEAI
jgi:hypothetical protein